MNDFLPYLAISTLIVATLWFVPRPKRKQLHPGIWTADLKALPDGLYSLLIRESSRRVAVYSHSTPIGQDDDAYFIHHYDLPKEKDGKKLKEHFLIENGKVVG